MSLITCCPTCQTMFQVSGEDLRVSDGWVRCGKCNGVFDASAYLQAMPEAQSVMQPVVQPEPELQTNSMAFEVDRAHDAFSTAPVDAEAPTEISRDELSPATFRREDQSARPSPSVTQQRVSITAPSSSRRASRRLVFVILMLAVTGAALLGWVRHERQALVQRVPALLPAFEALCRVSACEVKAPRLLDAIAIEEVALQEMAPSEYAIKLVLKNTGSGAVELPSLKVTLTGQQGEIIASHTASPLQFAPGLSHLAPNVPLSLALNFSATPAAAPAQASAPASAPASSAPTSGPAPSASAASAAAEPAPAEASPASAVPALSSYRVIAFYP